MKSLGLADKSIDFDSLIQNPQQAKALKEQIVLLIMQKDEDEKMMNLMENMSKEIDKEKEYTVEHIQPKTNMPRASNIGDKPLF